MKRLVIFILIAALFLFPIKGRGLSVLGEVTHYDSFGNLCEEKTEFSRVDYLGSLEGMTQDIENKLGGKILFTERVGELTIVYAYSKNLNNFKEVQGKTVNIMAAYSSLTAKIVVGSPLIMGSY